MVSTAGATRLPKMLQSGGKVRLRKSAICGRPAANSAALSCAPSALHCSPTTIAATSKAVVTQPFIPVGVDMTQAYLCSMIRLPWSRWSVVRSGRRQPPHWLLGSEHRPALAPDQDRCGPDHLPSSDQGRRYKPREIGTAHV